MPLPSFTIDESTTIYEILGEVAGGELSPAVLSAAEVTFKSNVGEDRFVTWDGSFYRIPPVKAKVTADGILRADNGPVTLLANDPGLSVEGLQWLVDVRIPDVKDTGRNVSGVTRMRSMRKWAFDAPADGVTVDLAATMPVTFVDSVGITRGPRGFTGPGFAGLLPTPDGLAVQPLVEGEEGPEPVGTAVPWTVDAVPSEMLTAAVASELDTQTPPAVSAEVAAAVPPAVDANIAGRAVTIADTGGDWQVTIGGVPAGAPFSLTPAAVAELEAQAPAVVAAEAATAVPAAVDADISGRSVTIADAGSGTWQFMVGGVATAVAFTLPSTTLSGIAAAGVCSRMTVQPTWARRALIEACIKSLIDGGVWEKLDGLYVMAAHDAQAARLNWVGGMQDLTAVNAPTFQIDRGYTGDGAAAYLDTNTAANGLERFTATDATNGIYVRTSLASSTALDIGVTGSGTQFSPSNTTNQAFGRANYTSGSAFAVANGGNRTGLFAWSRDASNVSVYRAGALLGSAAAPTGVLNSNTHTLLKVASGYSTRQLAAAVIGAGLSAGEHTALNTALGTYLTAVGAAV